VLTGDKELTVDEVEASAKIPNPLSLAPEKKGTVGRPKCLEEGTRRQHEVPDDPHGYRARIGQGATGIALVRSKYVLGCYRVFDVNLLSRGAIFMAMTAKDFYRSSNGDRWQLIRDIASGRSFVRHEPNLSSGGRTTDTDVEEFLNRTGSSPENLALRALLDKQTRTDGS
jgi:hypothetical protein